MTGSLGVTGSLIVNVGGVNELNIQQTGVTLGNVIGDIHRVTGSLNISGSQIINGNVGIGTTSPIGKLDVTLLNTRRFIVTYDDSIITIKGASDTGAGENLRIIGDNLIFNTNSVGSGTERMRITSAGDVLISTSTSATNPEGFARVLNIRSNDAALVLSNTNGTAKNWSLGAYDTGTFTITDGNSKRISVNSSGNIGIGTISPATRMQINDSGAGAYTILTIQNRQTRGAGVGARINLLPNSDFTAGVDTGAAISAVNSSGGTNNDTNLIFETSALGTGAERMRITSAGNFD
jgi:hypothetical protein